MVPGPGVTVAVVLLVCERCNSEFVLADADEKSNESHVRRRRPRPRRSLWKYRIKSMLAVGICDRGPLGETISGYPKPCYCMRVELALGLVLRLKST